MRDNRFLGHYFHLWENLVGAIGFFEPYEANSPFEICIGDQKLDKLENLMNSQFLRALFPNARRCKQRRVVAENVIVADRFGRKLGRLNKMLEFDQSRIMQLDSAKVLRQRVLENLGIKPQRDHKQALMIARNPPRKFSHHASAEV